MISKHLDCIPIGQGQSSRCVTAPPSLVTTPPQIRYSPCCPSSFIIMEDVPPPPPLTLSPSPSSPPSSSIVSSPSSSSCWQPHKRNTTTTYTRPSHRCLTLLLFLSAMIEQLLWRARADPFSYGLCDPTQQYLDISSLGCTACGTNKVPDTSVVDMYGNPLQCKCAPGFKETSTSCTDLVSSPG